MPCIVDFYVVERESEITKNVPNSSQAQYSTTPVTRTLKGNEKLFELAGFRVIGVD